MSGELARGLRISLAVHAVFAALILLVGAKGREGRPTVLIDFTLVEPERSAPDRIARASAPVRRSPPLPAAAAPPKPVPKTVAAPPPPERIAIPPPAEPVEAGPAPPPPVATALSEAQVRSPVPPEAGPAAPADVPGVVSPDPPFASSPASPPPAAPGTRPAHAETGPPAGAGTGGESAERVRAMYLERHYEYIREGIQRRIEYPLAARRMGWEGRVVVAFTIRADGTVRDVRVKESSGFPLLDRNAVEAVRGASPYPKPPAEAQILTPIVYTLR